MRLIIILILLNVISSNAQVVINEIMAAPNADEPEWIEIYNPSISSILLQKASLSDNVKQVPLPDLMISPKSYLILLKDSNLFVSKRSIPDGIPIVVCNLPGLNNTFDAVVVKDSNGVIIDSAFYDMSWGTKGKSLERIDHTIGAISNDNLKECKYSSGATAGEINSVTPKEYGIEITHLFQKTNDIVIRVENTGIEDIQQIHYRLEIKFENKSYFEKVDEGSIPSIVSNEIENITIDITEQLNNQYAVDSCKSTVFYDEKPDDIQIKTVEIFSLLENIKINEIMYDISTGNSEYIELRFLNLGKKTIKGLKIYDKSAWDNDKPIVVNDVINVFEYIVISMDSLIYNRFDYLEDSGIVLIPDLRVALNNGGDLIVITDMLGNIIDSLTYFDNWHDPAFNDTKNRSLILVDPYKPHDWNNWTSCPDEIGGNPGLINLDNTSVENETMIEVNPNPFSSAQSTCIIKYRFNIGTSVVTARIYTLNGAMINEIANNVYSSGVGEFSWNGKDHSGNRLPPGPYVIVLTATSSLTQNSIVGKSVIVIGE